MSQIINVVGGGVVGLWVAVEAVRRGHKVRLFEQFKIGHDKGSSHGDTRIFRSAYWEGSEYVKLAKQSNVMWKWLGSLTSEPIISLMGGYYIGNKNSSLISGVTSSANQHSLPINTLDPSFLIFDKDTIALEEQLAGVIYASSAMSTLKNFCLENNVEVNENTIFHERYAKDGVTVYCKGPWFSESPFFAKILESDRVYCHWFKHDASTKLFEKAFLIQGQDNRVIYGMPESKDIIKVGWHNYPIIPMLPGISESVSPDKFIKDIQEALSYITSKKLDFIKSKGCYFTNSLDENYIVDAIGDNKWVIAGLSGHGFKFAPALASGMLDAIEVNHIPKHLEFFSLKRFENKNIIPRTHIKEDDLMLGESWKV